jgi:hypothetical protein
VRWRWLLVLPVALAAMLVASANRLQTMWWPAQLHEKTTGREDTSVRVSDEWIDEDGAERHRELSVTLLKVKPAAEVETYSGVEELHPADDTAVWEITLRFYVDPEVPLGGCRVAVVDTRDRVSEAVGGTVGGIDLPRTSCEPEGHSGPFYDGTVSEGALPRPPSYEVTVYAVTSTTVEPERVRLWWEAPDLVEISLKP